MADPIIQDAKASVNTFLTREKGYFTLNRKPLLIGLIVGLVIGAILGHLP